MNTIVFTGAATFKGQPVLRKNLIKFAEDRGLTIKTTVTANTTYLVASRTDTVKAKAAKRLGVNVMTYDDFIDMCDFLEVV